MNQITKDNRNSAAGTKSFPLCSDLDEKKEKDPDGFTQSVV